MYHNIDFTKLGGYPLTQNTLAFLQEGYNQTIAAMTRAFGTYVILSGFTDNAGIRSDGWVIYNGEVLPIIGGPYQGLIRIEELTENKTFGDDNVNTVIYNRRVIMDAVNGVIPTTFLSIPIPLVDIPGMLNTLQLAIAAAQSTANAALAAATGSGIPSGTIILWSGSIASIPAGYFICDGANGTPNLRDKFVVGAGSAYAVAATGGADSVTLTQGQMPSHNHTMLSAGDHQHFVKEVVRGEEGSSGEDQTVGSYTETGTNKFTNFAGSHTHTLGNTGGGGSHENRPPYYALAYIMKS